MGILQQGMAKIVWPLLSDSRFNSHTVTAPFKSTTKRCYCLLQLLLFCLRTFLGRWLDNSGFCSSRYAKLLLGKSTCLFVSVPYHCTSYVPSAQLKRLAARLCLNFSRILTNKHSEIQINIIVNRIGMHSQLT